MSAVRSIIILSTLFLSTFVHAKPAPQENQLGAQQLLTAHYEQYKDQEYFSGAALSIYVPGSEIKNYYAGKVSHAMDSKNIAGDTLFQIGSITKSFTAAVAIQLDTAQQLSLQQTLKDWLPDYSKWSDVSITQLLNMTSGLPNYSDTPLWNTEEYNDPMHVWTNAELINFVYPKENFSPPRKSNYFYTNTGYVLTDLIIEKATKNSFTTELINRTIKPAGLKNTFYTATELPEDIRDRLASGYNYNQYDNPFLVGKKIQDNTISWAAAAGAVISTSEDVVKWVKALFINTTVLTAKEKQTLMQLVSVQTGKPIAKTSTLEPRGFGLGVIEAYDPTLGRFWFYEGETLGFRALYLYVPCNGVIIASIFNSATNSENDHASELMKKVYGMVINNNAKLRCKS